jgi:hypothetical protein
MSNSEFRLEGAKRWLKPYYQSSLEGTVNSSLHPYDNSDPVLIRWTASPVFSTSNNNASKPDAVILYGDIINGKISFNELIVSEFKDGYAATFYYNSTTSSFQLLSSVRKSSTGLVLDELVPEALQSIGKAMQSKSVSIVEGTYLGESFEMSGESFETSLYYACTTDAVPLLDSQYNPPLYQVRSTSNSHWISLRKRQIAIQVISVFVQVLSSVMISWVLFLPLHRFVQAMQGEVGQSKASKLRRESKAGGGLKQVLAKFGVEGFASKASQVRDSEVSNKAV